MPGMGSDLSPLTWATFFGTWRLQAGWLEAAVLLLGGYLLARRAAGAESTVRAWRVGSWIAGVVLMWVCVASAIGTYAMSVFWMHMVLHLLLIMVVPALLVLGHPLTVLLEAFHGPARERVQRVLHSWPVTVLSHPATGVLVYTATIIGTHLTNFMDQMAQHSWLMTSEQVLYVVAGYLFLQPLLGEEPTKPNPPYLGRLALLVAAMVPDTIVGIVLLQTNTVPFPVMMSQHPAWAPAALSDVHAAGGLMWAAGDGLMMLVAVALMISVITSVERRTRMTGAWLEGARRATLAEHAGADAETITDADSDEALDAYNKMLARMRERG
jgi:putative copper resistance protein D